jgi:hypothetical protein
MKVLYSAALAAALLTAGNDRAGADTQPPPAASSVIPPIVLQGCAEKIKAKRATLFANSQSVAAASRGVQSLGFDVSFVNTTTKIAKIVVIRIGDTDFTKIGKFSPDAVIAWRVAAHAGDCSVRAVRFDDGSEWAAPPDSVSAPVTSSNQQDR